MKLRQLEMLLEKIEGFENPDLGLEQYQTPAPLAARLLFHASVNGHITGKKVCDLGCGTGILSVGAALLGAAQVIGIDSDEKALKLARSNARVQRTDIEFITRTVTSSLVLPEKVQTIVMNPPFGARKRHADRAFIDCAIRSGEEIYMIANAGSVDFIGSYTEGRAVIQEIIEGVLPLRHSYSFHRKDVMDIRVEILHLSVPGLP
ncbi:MAG TPA: METTL5 family protein [Methanoregulaceae archaeon]|nr:METTL5 family protein [Methanoregulaceae archaeon]